MKKEEAVIVINVLLGADGGCPHCAWQLIEAFSEKFPQADVSKAVKHVTLSDETIRGKVLTLAKNGFLDKWRGLGDIYKALIEQFGWTIAKSSLQVELNRMVSDFLLGEKRDPSRKQRVYKLAANVAFKQKEVEA